MYRHGKYEDTSETIAGKDKSYRDIRLKHKRKQVMGSKPKKETNHRNRYPS